MADRVVRIVVAGDATSGLRALRQVESASVRTGRELERSGKEAEVAGEKFGRIGKGAGLLTSAVGRLAGIAGLAGLAFGIKDAVQAGIAWQAQQAQLQSALKATGHNSAATLAQINKAAEFSSGHGGFAATTEIAGITQFVTETHSATQAIRDNIAVVDVARRLHVDYSQAVSIVARAQTGATGKLQQYLGVIIPIKAHVQALTAVQKKLHPELLAQAQLADKLATGQMVNARILKYLGSATSDYSKTTAGALSNAQNAFETLAVKVGTVVEPAIKWVANTAAAFARMIVKDWPQISATVKQVFGHVKPILVDAVKVIRAVGKTFVDVVGAFTKNKAAVQAAGTAVGILAAGFIALKAPLAIQALVYGVAGAFEALDLAMAANPVGLIIAGVALLGAGLVYLYQKSSTFRSIVKDAFKVAEVGANLFLVQINAVISAINAMLSLINGAIKLYDSLPGFLQVVGHVNTIGKVGSVGYLGGSVLGPLASKPTGHAATIAKNRNAPHAKMTQQIAGIRSAHPGPGVTTHHVVVTTPVQLILDGRVAAETVARANLHLAARR